MESDIKEIKSDVKVLLQQSAVHNEILREHKNFSIALQQEQKLISERIRPIEKHVDLVGKILKISGAVFVGVMIEILVSLLLK